MNKVTTVYFVRHAQADKYCTDGANRPLTVKGMRDRQLVTNYLLDKSISIVYSSPYKRAVDTIADFTERVGISIVTDSRFREHERDNRIGVDSTLGYAEYIPSTQRLWDDFDLFYASGESLRELQNRNISALNTLLTESYGLNAVVGHHGLALSMVINFFDKGFLFDSFMAMVEKCPYIVKFTFEGRDFTLKSIEYVDLVELTGMFSIRLSSLSDVKRFVTLACQAAPEIEVQSGRYSVNAKSIMGLFSLDLTKDVRVKVIGDEFEAAAFKESVKEFVVPAQ